jgi:hypothetical protein
MPTISDQVAALEYDHADALAKIESQNRSLETLTLSLAAMTKEKLALEARIVEYQKHEEETIAAVEVLANASLDMLRIAQRPAGMPAEVIPYAPKLKTVTAASMAPSVGLADVLEMLEPEPARQAVAQATANDTVPRAAPSWPPKPAAVPIIEPMSAVDRIKRHFLPAVTLMRQPVDSAMRVDPGGLPMFLRRDTVFARTVDAA